MNRELEEFFTYKALAHKHSFANAYDLGLESEAIPEFEVKNVCTKMDKALSDRIDETCALLDIRKRKFIELAVIQALEDSSLIIHEYLTNEKGELEL